MVYFKMSNTIVCLKWGKKYSAKYVNILYESVKRNTTYPFEFICFTEDDTGLNDKISIRPLNPPMLLEGWWNKLYLFNSSNGLSGNIFYIDLDTVITKNIDDIINFNNDSFRIMSKGQLQETAEDKNKFKNDYASGIMSWDHSKYTYVWDIFEQNLSVCKKIPGDQDFIKLVVHDVTFFQDIFPNKIYSYKYQCYHDGLPDDASIICFHGQPSIEEAISTTVHPWGVTYEPRAWVANYWRM
jgi:hypothetical protein